MSVEQQTDCGTPVPLVMRLEPPLAPGDALERASWDIFFRFHSDPGSHPSEYNPSPNPVGDVKSKWENVVEHSDSASEQASSPTTSYAGDSEQSFDELPDPSGTTETSHGPIFGVRALVPTEISRHHDTTVPSPSRGKLIALDTRPELGVNLPQSRAPQRYQVFSVNLMTTQKIPADLEHQLGGRYNPDSETLPMKCILDSDMQSLGSQMVTKTGPRQQFPHRSMARRFIWTALESLTDLRYLVTTLVEENEKLPTAIGSSYSFAYKRWSDRISVDLQPGIVYAATLEFLQGFPSGLVGFSPLQFQPVYTSGSSRVEAPTKGFSLKSLTRRPYYCHNKDGKLSMNPFGSWISFSAWPIAYTPQTPKPFWSRKIPLISGAQHWAIRLLSVQFTQTDGIGGIAVDMPDCFYSFGDDGIVVALDTGASTSWAPQAFVSFIRTKVFPNPGNILLEQESLPRTVFESGTRVPYYVEGNDFPKVYIKYRFTGLDGGVVEVEGPAEQFIAGLSPRMAVDAAGHPRREGLVFVAPPDTISGGAVGMIFGLNVFQSMFVSLHKPRTNQEVDPYVRLAPQHAMMRKDYRLPPLSQ
ncbi:hypothetical protein V8D89_002290 [Ganoderma adspersum]